MSEFTIFSWVLSAAAIVAVLMLSRSQRSNLHQREVPPSTTIATHSTSIYAQVQRETFEQLQAMLVNYPSAIHMAQQYPSLPARNLTALFTPLDQVLQRWGYERIGEPWQQVVFDPQIHQPDASDIQPGDIVYVRFVGYREGNDILCPAKVSRSLPHISVDTL